MEEAVMAGESTTSLASLSHSAEPLDKAYSEGFPMELDELRCLTRNRLQCGELPREKCQVTWFGPGVGEPCALCGRSITRLEIECECEQANRPALRFHQACFAVWDEERQQVG
jgi:hypothetical protein